MVVASLTVTGVPVTMSGMDAKHYRYKRRDKLRSALLKVLELLPATEPDPRTAVMAWYVGGLLQIFAAKVELPEDLTDSEQVEVVGECFILQHQSRQRERNRKRR